MVNVERSTVAMMGVPTRSCLLRSELDNIGANPILHPQASAASGSENDKISILLGGWVVFDCHFWRTIIQAALNRAMMSVRRDKDIDEQHVNTSGCWEEAALDLHPFDLVRWSHTADILHLGGFLTRVPGQLNSGIVVMKGRQSVFIFWQQRDDESEVVEHARVRSQLRMARYYLVRQLI
jgi:hypothetical protein